MFLLNYVMLTIVKFVIKMLMNVPFVTLEELLPHFKLLQMVKQLPNIFVKNVKNTVYPVLELLKMLLSREKLPVLNVKKAIS